MLYGENWWLKTPEEIRHPKPKPKRVEVPAPTNYYEMERHLLMLDRLEQVMTQESLSEKDARVIQRSITEAYRQFNVYLAEII